MDSFSKFCVVSSSCRSTIASFTSSRSLREKEEEKSTEEKKPDDTPDDKEGEGDTKEKLPKTLLSQTPVNVLGEKKAESKIKAGEGSQTLSKISEELKGETQAEGMEVEGEDAKTKDDSTADKKEESEKKEEKKPEESEKTKQVKQEAEKEEPKKPEITQYQIEPPQRDDWRCIPSLFLTDGASTSRRQDGIGQICEWVRLIIKERGLQGLSSTSGLSHSENPASPLLHEKGRLCILLTYPPTLATIQILHECRQEVRDLFDIEICDNK